LAQQLSLFDDNPLRDAFDLFHAQHPEVYVWLREKALGLRHRGREHYGLRALWEVLRFHTAMGDFHADYRLNDHHPPFYARLLMRDVPELRGFFETRAAAADEPPSDGGA
jgi:hypothetical protein